MQPATLVHLNNLIRKINRDISGIASRNR